VYSPRIIAAVIRDFADAKDRNGNRIGFEPIRREIWEVDDFNAYIESITDKATNKLGSSFDWKPGKEPTAKRAAWIKRWCQSEKFLCFADAEYFVTRYAKIRTFDERIIHFEFRLGQRILLEVLAEFEDLQLAIQIFALKCRQVGVSTMTALFFLHRILWRANTHAIMASFQVPQSEKLQMMIDTAWERLPFWLPPEKTILKAKEPKWANGSALSIQAGSQTVGIAQGSTPTCIHLTEIADYENPIKTIEEGLFPAAHQTSSLFFVIEGTGSLASPWQKNKWEAYKAKSAQRNFRPIFIPPACASDLYPPADWLRGCPVPEGWNPPLEVLRMKRRGELYVRSTDYLAEFLGADWEMPIEFLWYWWLGWNEAVKSHSEKTFLAMNAVTDQDAFQSKNDPVFSDEVIDIVTKERHVDYRAYAITGRTIIIGRDNKPYEPSSHEIDYNAERIPLRWEANDGNVYTWELIPLKPFDDSSDEACFNKLLVFEEPQDGKRYSEGVDVAQGLGLPNEDRSCCAVLRNAWGKDRDNQAAVFTSLDVNSAQMARIAAAIAVYFTTDGAGTLTCGDPLGMRFIIEQIRKSGDECLNQLQLMGFYNHHVMHFYDDKDSTTHPDKGRKLGWRTVEWSRDILLNKFVGYVNTGWLKLNDPIAIRQLKTFIRRKVGEDKAKMIHEKGEHDDNIFAPAMALQTAHDIEDQSMRITKSYIPPKDDGPVSEEWAENSVVID
jgi:hypothetical protein